MSARGHKARIVVEGVELTIEQTRDAVSVSRVVGKDRSTRPAADLTRSVELGGARPDALVLVEDLLRHAARLGTERCTCDYRVGYSDHAAHCKSSYVARYDAGGLYD